MKARLDWTLCAAFLMTFVLAPALVSCQKIKQSQTSSIAQPSATQNYLRGGGPVDQRKVVILLSYFQDDPGEPFSVGEVRDAVFTGGNSFRDFFEEMSFGKISLRGINDIDGDIYGWFPLPLNASSCSRNIATIKQTALQLYPGLNLSGYDHIVTVTKEPKFLDCWGINGDGTRPGQNSWIKGNREVFFGREGSCP